MELQEFWGLAGVPVVIAALEAIKRTVPELSQRWFWLLALGIAALVNIPIAWRLGTDPVLAGLIILVTSLAASGLYGQGKALLGK